jgi:hypothetical protein
MSFASVARESRRCDLIMLETHIAMSSLIFRLVLILVLHLASFMDQTIGHMVLIHERTTFCLDALVTAYVLIMVHLASFMDQTISHMVLIHERTTFCLDALVTAYVLIMVIVSLVGMVFLLEGLILTLSPHTWTVHVFPVVVHVPLVQMVRCKRL